MRPSIPIYTHSNTAETVSSSAEHPDIPRRATMALLLLILLATGIHCQEEVLHVALQRDTVSAVYCPLKTTDQVTWTELEGGQKGVQWEKHLIFTNVEGPESQLYRCQYGNVSALVNVTVNDVPVNTTDGTIGYCQHGKPCALQCSLAKEPAMSWPGMALEKELWWGEEWTKAHIKGESLMMISPGVMIADYLRNPSLVGCKQLYYITEAGHALTGLPVGHTMNSRTKRMKMEIIRPYSQIVRPVYKDLRKIVFIQVRVGQRLEIECEGIAWEDFDYMYWLTKPCRNDKCELDFIPSEGRMIEQSMNTSLVESMLGYPVSQKLVLDPVDKSDLKSTFYCKLDSSGEHDILTVYLRERDEMFGLADSIY